MTVRIKRLELHGFKSFPRSTVFEFDSGITAVIGPNGSGKSNIADALRWVLGEQSYANLRGRKAEDVIFSGSGTRAPAGMAEVTLTLDNTSGDLPIDFQEVSITRRAYRSGENQYLINGARVRLKDVNQITASLGQSHTVIGQGLVDAALSQRPDERRSLFEHAAGITGLRLKYAATARHLNETESNSQRLEDLLNELEPRLKTLERQAKQAREYAAVQAELRETALRYYGGLWKQQCFALAQAEQESKRSEEQLADSAGEVEEARDSQSSFESEIRALEARSTALERSVREAQETITSQEHRIELLCQRRESFSGEIDRLQRLLERMEGESEQVVERRASLVEESAALQTELARIDSALEQRKTEQVRHLERVDALRTERSRCVDERDRLIQEKYRVQAKIDYRAQSIADLRDRSASYVENRRELEQVTEELLTSARHVDECLSRFNQQIDELEKSREAIEETQRKQSARIEKLGSSLESLTSERSGLAARLDALQRLRESGEGLQRGVQEVLKSAKSGRLSGIVGTLAQQISVEDELETAVEAALGSHLQDVVVERWRDAEAAIAHLKEKDQGRATFQPLDTVCHNGPRQRLPNGSSDGVRGIAADLVEFDASLEPVIHGLLGRVVITEHLAATRSLIGTLKPGWTAVTLEGEVSRSGGSVTGGSRVRATGTLARERELRGLPSRVEKLDREIEQLRDSISNTEKEHEATREQLDQVAEQLSETRQCRDSATRDRESLLRQRSELADRLETLDRDEASARSSAEQLESELTQFEEGNQRLGNCQQELAARISEHDSSLAELESYGDDPEQSRLENERTRLQERARGLERDLIALDGRLSELDQERVESTTALDEVRQAVERLETETAEIQLAHTSMNDRHRALKEELEPLAERRTELGAHSARAKEEITQRERSHRELERLRDQRQLDVQRCQSQVELLLERASDVLEQGDLREALEQQPVDPEFDEPQLEQALHRLRQRTRRISAFGEETITEFEQEQERYRFLRQQLDDIQRGAEALQSMLADLERSMSTEFDRTFGQVAQAFSLTFKRLFGGGTAQLVRTDDEEGSVGIDIVAQPPGKRLQSLALLSGGERALTAAALLFAILRVNPSPFCLLDEVDAALDESNVVRFRTEVRDLAVRTQFVLVTHNRSTIEGADVLYGITMGDDALSRVVSLKLPAEMAPA